MLPIRSQPLGGNSRQSNPNVRAGYRAQNQLKGFHAVIVDLPQSDPHNTILPPHSVKPQRVSPRSSPECNLVRNPCVRGGS